MAMMAYVKYTWTYLCISATLKGKAINEPYYLKNGMVIDCKKILVLKNGFVVKIILSY